jgi:hypothetical protein
LCRIAVRPTNQERKVSASRHEQADQYFNYYYYYYYYYYEKQNKENTGTKIVVASHDPSVDLEMA